MANKLKISRPPSTVICRKLPDTAEGKNKVHKQAATYVTCVCRALSSIASMLTVNVQLGEDSGRGCMQTRHTSSDAQQLCVALRAVRHA